MLGTFFVVLALVLFLLAAFGVPSGRFNLVAGGLAALTLGVWLLPLL
jgi:hypothetical protein